MKAYSCMPRVHTYSCMTQKTDESLECANLGKQAKQCNIYALSVFFPILWLLVLVMLRHALRKLYTQYCKANKLNKV